MIDVIVIGAGGHAAEIDEYISYNNKHSADEGLHVIGFLDDNPESYSRYKFSAPLSLALWGFMPRLHFRAF